MRGKLIRLSILSALLAAGGVHAWAETPSENLTVTATNSREVLGAFTRAFAGPAPVTGKMMGAGGRSAMI